MRWQDIQEIGCFSYDANHKYQQDERSLRYYYPPKLGADLCKGFETFRSLDDAKDEHLEGLLKAIIHIEKETGEKCEADLIAWRGMMTKVKSILWFNSKCWTEQRSWQRQAIGWWAVRKSGIRARRAIAKTNSFEMNATRFQVGWR